MFPILFCGLKLLVACTLTGQTLFPVWGCGRKCGGEKEFGVSGPYSVAMWNAIIGKVT